MATSLQDFKALHPVASARRRCAMRSVCSLINMSIKAQTTKNTSTLQRATVSIAHYSYVYVRHDLLDIGEEMLAEGASRGNPALNKTKKLIETLSGAMKRFD